jgi:predicted deacylase
LLLLLAVGLASCAAPAVSPAAAPLAEIPRSATDDKAPASVTPESADPWFTLAVSRAGRPIRAATFGHGPRRVLWVGGIHGDEREGALATAELPAAFLAEPGAAERVTLTVIEDLNPDGTAARRRTNERGVDLNRNFPAASFRAGARNGLAPLSEPESLALFELVAGWQPELVLVAHAWRGAQFVNFDGPARAEAEAFAARAGFELRESQELEPTPGSLGSWANERGVRVLTLEYRRGMAPADAWQATRAAILAAVLGPPGTAGLQPGSSSYPEEAKEEEEEDRARLEPGVPGGD